MPEGPERVRRCEDATRRVPQRHAVGERAQSVSGHGVAQHGFERCLRGGSDHPPTRTVRTPERRSNGSLFQAHGRSSGKLVPAGRPAGLVRWRLFPDRADGEVDHLRPDELQPQVAPPGPSSGAPPAQRDLRGRCGFDSGSLRRVAAGGTGRHGGHEHERGDEESELDTRHVRSLANRHRWWWNGGSIVAGGESVCVGPSHSQSRLVSSCS